MTLEQRYLAIQKQLAAYPRASLIAVSKYTDHDNIRRLAALGQKDFAESRPQQLRDRAKLFPELHFHMIGPLQKNKAKYIGRYASMWHSLSDMATARVVNQYAVQRPLPTLLQVKLGHAPQQQGIAIEQLKRVYLEAQALENLEIQGLMCMAPESQNAREIFQTLKTLLCDIGHEKLSALSMGMSGDFHIALAEGATMIRLGSALFKHQGNIE